MSHPLSFRHRRRLALLLGAAVLLTGVVAAPSGAGFRRSDGPPNGHAGDPVLYRTCTTCHTGNALGAGDGSFEVDLPANYTPGTTYTITMTLEDPGQSRWGFQISPRFGDNSPAGVLVSSNTLTKVSTDTLGRQFGKQTLSGSMAGTVNGPVSWTLEWTAPPAGSGTVHWYAAANAANNNGARTGDFIYALASASAEDTAGAEATLVLQPESTKIARNDDLVVHAFVRNHRMSAGSILLASRVRLASGNYFPASGFLLPPITVPLTAEGLSEATMTHPVPATAPLLTATYEAHVGHAPLTLVDSDEFVFSILP